MQPRALYLLVDRLVADCPGRFGYSVSHTTRGPRPGEVEGVDYYFTNERTMRHDMEQGGFIEHAEVHGNRYGTSAAAVDEVILVSSSCILAL